MNRMSVLRRAVAGVAIAGGATVALLLPGGAAVADQSGGLELGITVEPTAQLVARGAAVDVQVEYTCNTTTYSYVSVQVSQRVGGQETATGNGSVQVACTGQSTRTIVRVEAQNNAFRKGVAAVTGTVSGCGSFGCGTETDDAVVTFER